MKKTLLVTIAFSCFTFSLASAATNDHTLNPTFINFELKSFAIRSNTINQRNTSHLLSFMNNTATHKKLRDLSYINDGPLGFDVSYTGAINILTEYTQGKPLDDHTREFLLSDLAQIVYVCTHKA